jgi:hypothetical protein
MARSRVREHTGFMLFTCRDRQTPFLDILFRDRRRWAAVVALGVAPASPAAAATFSGPTPVAGFGDTPALAQVAGAALAQDGSSAIAGSAQNTGLRQVVAAFGNATSPPAAARGFGPASGTYDVTFASNVSGDVAVAYSVGHVAYLTMCHGSRCATQRVGASAVKPQPAVAVQPRTGRTIVLWRGHTARGLNRLQWRVTSGSRLGRTHTLGEFGDTPRVVTDASGSTVAAWRADGRAGRHGVRTATRSAGEFAKVTTLTSAPAAALQLITSDAGSTVAAWLGGTGSGNPEGPLGTVEVATRTASSSFGAPVALGSGSTVSLAGSRDGHALLVTDRHVGGTSVIVSASRRDPNGAFGPLTDVSPAQFVSDAYPAAGAVSDGGRALVSWASASDPSGPTPSGVFATVAETGAGFGAPQQLADARTATLPQPTAGAITSSAALVAWTGPQGARVVRGGGA